MRIDSFSIHSKGFRLDCECGHHRQLDRRVAMRAWGQDAEYEQVKPRLRCSACGGKKVRLSTTETADGSLLRLADLRLNIFHRCGDHNCLQAWWATPDEARAIAPGGTLEDYKRVIACPQCGRLGRYHHVRLTDDTIPEVTRWMGMSANEREAKRRR